MTSSDEEIYTNLLGSKHHIPTQGGDLDPSETWDPIKQLSRNTNIGTEQLKNNQRNLWLSTQDMPYTQRQQTINAGIQKIQDGYTQEDQQAEPWHQQIINNVEQSLPGFGDMALQGGVGAAAGAATGAGIGAVAGEGIGAVPGAGIGYKWGMTAGMFKSSTEQAAGQMYGELIQAGVDHETSRNIAYTVGAVNGALITVGGSALTGIAGKAVTQAEKSVILKGLSTTFVKEMSKNFAGRMAMDIVGGTAINTATITGAALNNEVAKVVAGMLQKNNPEAFTDWATAMKNVSETFTSSLMTGAVLSAAAHGAGKAVGSVTGKVKLSLSQLELEHLKNKTPQEILQNVKSHLDERPNPWENVTETHEVVYDESGHVYIKTGIKDTFNKEPGVKSGVKVSEDQKPQHKLQDVIHDPQHIIDTGLADIYPQEKTLTAKQVEEDSQLRLALQYDRPLNPTEIKGRLNQIASDIKVLKKEETRLESEITLKEKTGQASHVLIDKWRKVTNTVESLKAQRDHVEAGLGTTHTEKANDIKLRMGSLTKVFDNLTETAKRLTVTKKELARAKQEGQDIGFKKGQYSTEKTIRRIQTGLTQIIHDSTDDPKIRDTAKKYIAKVTTPKQAEKAIAQIKGEILKQEAAKFEAANEKDRLDTYNAVVKLVETKYITTKNGYPVSKIPEETAHKLQLLKTFLKSKAELAKFYTRIVLEHGETHIDNIPDKVKEQLTIADMAHKLHNGDVLSRNITAANIAQEVLDGKNIIAAKRKELQIKKENLLTNARKSLRVKENSIIYNKNQKLRLKHNINNVGSIGYTLNTLTDLMTPHDKTKTLTKILDETESRHNYLRAVEQTIVNAHLAIESHMKNNGLKGTLVQKTWDDNQTLVKITYTGKNNKSITTPDLTRGEMLDVVLKSKRPSMHKGLREGNEFTLPGDVPTGESTIERIEAVLTPADRAQIEATLAFYPSYHESVNEVYKAHTGASLPMDEGYTRGTRKGFQVDAPYTSEGLQIYNLLPGSAKSVKDSSLPLQFHNPMEDIVTYVKQWEFYKHYGDLIERSSHILTDKKIVGHINDTYGEGTMKVLRDYHERFVKNTPIPFTPGKGFWQAMQADFSQTVLGLNPLQFATTFPFGMALWANYSPAEILTGVGKTILHPKQTSAAIKNAPILRERIHSGTVYELEHSLHNSGLFAHTAGYLLGVEPTLEDARSSEMLKRFIYSAHIGSEIAVQHVFGSPVYHAEIARGAAHEQAILQVERLIEQTQTSRSVSQTPPILASSVSRTFISQFSQAPLQISGRLQVAFKDWALNMNDPAAFMKLGGVIAATTVVPGALSALARVAPLLINNPNVDTGEEGDAPLSRVLSALHSDPVKVALHGILGGAALGAVGGAPILGDMVQSIWFQSAKAMIGVDLGGHGGLARSNIVSEIYDNTKLALQRWNKIAEPNDPTKLPDINKEETTLFKAEFATSQAASFATGLPKQTVGAPLTAFHQASQGDPLGAAFALWGNTPNMLARRIPRSGMEIPKLEEPKPNTYDTILSYLEGATQHEGASKSKAKDDEIYKHLLDGATK